MAEQALGAWVGALVDELARCGVAHACLCPGARSTPLALALRRHPGIRLWPLLDERSAAFFALGMGRASGVPTAVVSTSGTAAAELLPAVTEAHHGRVPLLVLTADRPPELRDVGALQTIDQVRLYGSRVKWAVDMLLPDASDAAIRQVRSVACRAAERTVSQPCGPVHLNLPFREPLIPTPVAASHRTGPLMTWRHGRSRLDRAALCELAETLLHAERGLIVCGPQDQPGLAAAVAALGRSLGFPVLADALSQVRYGTHHGPGILDAFDAFLRAPEVAATLRPDLVLRFGAVPVSRPLQRFLAQHHHASQILVDEGDGLRDPDLVTGEVVRADPATLCCDLLEDLPENAARDQTWLVRWQEFDARSRAAIQAELAAREHLSEPAVAGELGELLPAGATVFVSNSMPVRDLDGFLWGRRAPLRVLANRGASGIDGVVSTGLGAAAVSPGPTVLVLGDLALAHDMNGLLAAARFELDATIVVVNNDGGGIFSFLPQHDHGEHFEELFAAPHGLDLGRAAAVYGIEHLRVDTRPEFRETVTRSLATPGPRIIEVPTDRDANTVLHHRLWAEVAAAITDTVEVCLT